tara:strand:+ start:349 stop:510 length:162 start_codon:yes stop_codon:yes gene_type:complete
MENQGSKKNTGHGPGAGTFGVKGKVANVCPAGAGKGVIGSKVGKVSPGTNGKG